MMHFTDGWASRPFSLPRNITPTRRCEQPTVQRMGKRVSYFRLLPPLEGRVLYGFLVLKGLESPNPVQAHRLVRWSTSRGSTVQMEGSQHTSTPCSEGKWSSRPTSPETHRPGFICLFFQFRRFVLAMFQQESAANKHILIIRSCVWCF